MPNTQLVPQDISRTGVVLEQTATDQTDWMYFYNDGNIILFFHDDTGTATVTIYTPNTVDGLAITDLTVTCATHATEGKFVGPFPPSIYNHSDGTVRFLVDLETNITANAFRLVEG